MSIKTTYPAAPSHALVKVRLPSSPLLPGTRMPNRVGFGGALSSTVTTAVKRHHTMTIASETRPLQRLRPPVLAQMQAT
ncbi:hypothetical protein CCM_02563 [Cordyceps militaris CM01]|uniref:Uncharacterized protein n=1 Tax=Cordyceps militaris (strain CM01) TaxID=983644 RepID=G3JAH6_CORMM|nr:uncharacterized protein CCM_02563 [Cordyceps militaris CM01]EGX94292.1 hypothetical protein CCM_02563 [Cordyceps militaris CM01]